MIPLSYILMQRSGFLKFSIKIISLFATLLIFIVGCESKSRNTLSAETPIPSSESISTKQNESESETKIIYEDLDVDELEVLANQNDLNAQVQLGYLYDFGKKVEQNSQKALEWYTKAAEQGDSEAQRVLGKMYYRGKGTEQNTEEAIKWLTKAVDQDNEEAKELLEKIESLESNT